MSQHPDPHDIDGALRLFGRVPEIIGFACPVCRLPLANTDAKARTPDGLRNCHPACRARLEAE